MKITAFLTDLFETGKVIVGSEIEETSPDEAEKVRFILQKYYDAAVWNMPATPPDFEPKSALWAAEFVYRTLHLTILRHIDSATVEQLLADFEGETTPETIYSVDLSFRYLPELLMLAKGLAPSDKLVDLLKIRLQRWCFSAVGVDLGHCEEVKTREILFNHPSLRIAYVDRIIQKKDLKRALCQPESEYIKAALGDYPSVLWADFARSAAFESKNL